MLTFFQWALSAGFWRFAGAVVLLSIAAWTIVALATVLAHVVAAFRRTG